jgi:uncharacterized protein (DUF2236 family)
MNPVVAAGLPFGPGTMSWRINREPIAVALGGPRAVVLQVAHPLVAAGVGDHSDYRRDPWVRGARTVDWLFKIQFSDPATVARQAAALRAVHQPINGVSGEGVPYHALDPELLLWVWATIVDSLALAYDRFVQPLTPAGKDRYYDEQRILAGACGIPSSTSPSTWDEFQGYMAGMIATELRVGPVTRQAAAGAAPFFRPPASAVLRPIDHFLFAALLPANLRADLGMKWGRGPAGALRAATSISRTVCRVVPRQVRHAPVTYLVRRPTPLVIRPPAAVLRRVS